MNRLRNLSLFFLLWTPLSWSSAVTAEYSDHVVFKFSEGRRTEIKSESLVGFGKISASRKNNCLPGEYGDPFFKVISVENEALESGLAQVRGNKIVGELIELGYPRKYISQGVVQFSTVSALALNVEEAQPGAVLVYWWCSSSPDRK
ncbi:hypothetical protein ACFJGW_12350 [Burkholderiaceae bacterium UC74_6]